MKKIITLCVLALSTLAVSLNVEARGITIEFNSAKDTTEVYNIVDEMPEIEGGLAEVYKHIEYPSVARKKKVEGRVFIKFVIDENGKVLDPVILKDIGDGCGEAAIEGIKKVKFTPGKHKGKPVKVYYTLPVTFKLKA